MVATNRQNTIHNYTQSMQTMSMALYSHRLLYKLYKKSDIGSDGKIFPWINLSTLSLWSLKTVSKLQRKFPHSLALILKNPFFIYVPAELLASIEKDN